MSIITRLTKRLTNYDSPQSIGSKLRAKRIAPLLSIISAVSKEFGRADIIDIGGTDKYWGIIPQEFLENKQVKITIVNLPGAQMPDDYGPFKFVHADGTALTEFSDNSFHIAHSNSVVEHVGDWDRMVRFAREFKRVAPKYFIQTPNYWFPIEPHCMTPFYHWLPKPMRIWLTLNFSLGHWSKANSVDEAIRKVESARLLNRKMFHELFSDADILTERMFLLPKSHIGIRK